MRKLFVLSAILASGFILTACASGTTVANAVKEQASHVSHKVESTQSLASQTSKKVAKPNKSTKPQGRTKIPMEYQSALRTAKFYVNTMHMSKKHLKRQLTSNYGEKFSDAAATYALNQLSNVDWKDNALATAKSYQKDMAMSPERIRSQLTSEYGEGFTEAEATYAINHLPA